MMLGEDGVPCTWTHTPDHQRGPLQKTAEVGVCRRSLLGSGSRAVLQRVRIVLVAGEG